jgi:hypothetical protein
MSFGEGRESAVLPDSAFPEPLPLGREGGLELLARQDDYRRPGGAFLTFVMVPTASRFGDWLFAGVSRALADAADRVEELIAASAVFLRFNAPASLVHSGRAKCIRRPSTKGPRCSTSLL